MVPYQDNARDNAGIIEDTEANFELPAISRGLQIPTRFSTVALGFKYPPILEASGITKKEFRAFTKELKGLVGLSKGQWLGCICCSCAIAILSGPFVLVLGPAAYLPASTVGYKMAQRKRRRNLSMSQDAGIVEQVVSRWNKTFFRKRGLVCRVDLPRQVDDMTEMDVTNSALYKYQVKIGELGSIPGTMSGAPTGDRKKQKKQKKLQAREGRYRQKSSQRMRIILAPIDGPHNMQHHYDSSQQSKRSAHSSRRLGNRMENEGQDHEQPQLGSDFDT